MTTSLLPPIKSMRTQKTLGYGFVCLIWILTIILAFFANNDDTIRKYHISNTTLHYLTVVLSLPSLFIWLAILFAGFSFYEYSQNIAGSKESPGFRYTAYGFFVMLAGSLLGSVLGGLQPLFSQNATDTVGVLTTFVIITNYLSVASSLATTGFFFRGSNSLLASAGSRLSQSKQFTPLLVPFASLTVAYVWLIFINPSRQTSTDPSIAPTFGLPDYPTLLTVAIPLIFSWLLGVAALMGFYAYRAKTKGIIYKQLFKKLVAGMTLLIALTILLQLVTQFSTFWASQGFTAVLLLIAVIYILLVYAFVLVAQGARRLNKIETIQLNPGAT